MRSVLFSVVAAPLFLAGCVSEEDFVSIDATAEMAQNLNFIRHALCDGRDRCGEIDCLDPRSEVIAHMHVSVQQDGVVIIPIGRDARSALATAARCVSAIEA